MFASVDDFATSSAIFSRCNQILSVNHIKMTMEGWVHFMKLGFRGEICPGAIAI